MRLFTYIYICKKYITSSGTLIEHRFVSFWDRGKGRSYLSVARATAVEEPSPLTTLCLRTPATVHGSGACGLRRLIDPGHLFSLQPHRAAAEPWWTGVCCKWNAPKKVFLFGMAMLPPFRSIRNWHNTGSRVWHITKDIYVDLAFNQN